MSGSISVDTAGLNPPLLTGSILSVSVSAILVPIISFIAPCKPFDWEELNTRITTTEDVVRGRPRAWFASGVWLLHGGRHFTPCPGLQPLRM